MNTKTLRAPLTFKESSEPGSVTAVFSTFDVVDSDNDIVLATALTHGQAVPMTWSHRWDLPVGKGTVLVQDKAAIFDGAFFLDTDAGLEAWKTVKAMGTLQEWSWGFRVIDAAYEQRGDQFVRLIKRAEVFEVSPVLVGAGVGTYTLGIKDAGQTLDAQYGTALAAVTDLSGRLRSLADLRAKEGRTLSTANRKRLETLLEALNSVTADISQLLADTEPPEKSAAVWSLLEEYNTIRARIAGL